MKEYIGFQENDEVVSSTDVPRGVFLEHHGDKLCMFVTDRIGGNTRERNIGEAYQYTGFDDKEDNKIFDGSILCDDGVKRVVFWDETFGWCVTGIEECLYEVNFSRVKVIGHVAKDHEMQEGIKGWS